MTPETAPGAPTADRRRTAAPERDDDRRMLLTGNHAAAYGAMLARPEVVPIYPITPQTPIAEKISGPAALGRVRRRPHDGRVASTRP